MVYRFISKDDVLLGAVEGHGNVRHRSRQSGLDFGVDSFARVMVRRVVGLPATLTRRDYAMTATVTEDAELVFWSLRDLDFLLQRRPDFCRQLLEILGERMAENQKMMKAMLRKDQQPLDEPIAQLTAI
jgi:CRP-like cAMP-binding protein